MDKTTSLEGTGQSAAYVTHWEISRVCKTKQRELHVRLEPSWSTVPQGAQAAAGRHCEVLHHYGRGDPGLETSG